MTALVARADAMRLPLADESVDLVVTSPPYYALRSYTDGGEHYDGQLGDEPTPQEYVAHLLEATREMVRVLKPGGSIFVNLGDKYARPGGGSDRSARSLPGAGRGATGRRATPGAAGAREKSLLLLPELYRVGCVYDLGLVARAVIVWDKPNGLPESVTDRVRRSHEEWVHITCGPRYYSAVDEIREPHAPATVARAQPHRAENSLDGQTRGMPTVAPHSIALKTSMHSLGALPGSVWRIAAEPLHVPPELEVDHYAAFPSEWPRRLILGWSPPAICTSCGEGRRPTARVHDDGLDRESAARAAAERVAAANGAVTGGTSRSTLRHALGRTVVGYVCACTPYTDHPADGYVREWREYHVDRWDPPPGRPAVVLDPFGGTGTTAMVANALGRVGLSFDRSGDYAKIARWRTTDPAQAAKVRGEPFRRASPQVDGQVPLFR